MMSEISWGCFGRICALLIAALVISSEGSLIVLVYASTGNILIGTTVPPSSPVEIEIGGSVSLYFGGVTWSGGQVELYLSKDGYGSLSPDNVEYGPTFSVAKVTSSIVDNTTYLGYSVGNDWINGTIPITATFPGGDCYVKAFDGASSVAVTDNYIRIKAAFEVTPPSGAGQTPLELRGYALPANGHANLSYNDGSGWKTIANLSPANQSGRLIYAINAPDLGKVLPAGLNSETYSTITFRLVVNETGQVLTDTFDEYWRGLKNVYSPDSINLTAPSGLLFGNGTDFLYYKVHVRPKSTLTMSGKWFSVDAITIMWDGITVIGSAVADKNGFFKTTVTIPLTSEGLHNVLIKDANVRFTFKVNCLPLVDLTAPIANAGPDMTVPENTRVIFDGSGSTDNIGIVNFAWSFFDVTAQVLTGANPAYNFTRPGAYVVMLNVTDIAGNWDTDILVVTVVDVTNPVADAGPDRTVDEDTLATLDGSNSSDNVEIAGYVWTFTDAYPQTLYGAKPTYTFRTPGVYTITLTVSDPEENQGGDTIVITVRDVTSPVAEAGPNQTVVEDTVIIFDAGNSRDNVGIASYEWDFGDGTNGTSLSTDHTYAHPGNFTASLTVRDAANNSDTDLVFITVLLDTDGDGTPDTIDSDDDGDGMSDTWESAYQLNPLDPADASRDDDGDGLTNLQEYVQGSSPNDPLPVFRYWILGIAVAAIVVAVAIVSFTKVKVKVAREEFVNREISEFDLQSADIKEKNPDYYEWRVNAIRQEAEKQFDELRQKGYLLANQAELRQILSKELRKKIRGRAEK